MELILHIGAHRTGTTAMQDMLVANAPVLAARGTCAVVHDALVPATGFAKVAHGEEVGPARAWFDARIEGAQQVIVSEENIIGDMGWNIRSGTFYKSARDRMLAYRDFFGLAPHCIGLGIREYGAYWVSAHGKELSYRNYRGRDVPRFDRIRDRLASAERGWLDLIADIRAVFSQSDILVWPVEARVPVEDQARALLAAPDLALAPPPANVNASPPAGVIPALESFRSAHPTAKRAAIHDWIAGQEPARFDGFTDAQLLKLGTLYARDIEVLEGGFGDVVLCDGPAQKLGGT